MIEAFFFMSSLSNFGLRLHRYHKVDFFVFVFFVTVLSIPFLMKIIKNYINDVKLEARGIEAEAEVTSEISDGFYTSKFGNKVPIFAKHDNEYYNVDNSAKFLEFYVGNERYCIKCSNKNVAQIGDKLTVLYLPENPDIAKPGLQKAKSILVPVLAAIYIIGVIFFWIWFFTVKFTPKAIIAVVIALVLTFFMDKWESW